MEGAHPNSGEELATLDESNDIFSNAGDFVLDVVGGVPGPIRKNALKAFAQLCTAALDVPIAHLEGLAAEKRAESKARQALLSLTSAKISEQMSVDERFIAAASNKFSKQILREKINLQKVSSVACEEIKLAEDLPLNENSETKEISDDWLNQFEREASTKSSEEMQFLFGKILAGEIIAPRSFSIRTIRLLGQLDTEVAKIFAKFCSLTISRKYNNKVFDARVLPLGDDKVGDPLRDYGVFYGELLLLQENGLISAELQTHVEYKPCIVQPNQPVEPFLYNGENWLLMPNVNYKSDNELWVSGPCLSSVGKELMAILDIEPNDSYTDGLKAYFGKLGLDMFRVDIK